MNYRKFSLGAMVLALLVASAPASAAEKGKDAPHAPHLLKCAAICAIVKALHWKARAIASSRSANCSRYSSSDKAAWRRCTFAITIMLSEGTESVHSLVQ